MKKITLTTTLASLAFASSSTAAITVVSHETFNGDSLGVLTAVGAGAGSVTYVDGAQAGDRAVQFDGTLGLTQTGLNQVITVGQGFGIEVILTPVAPLPGFSFGAGLTTGDNQGVGILEQGGWNALHQGVGAGSPATATVTGQEVRLALIWAAGADQTNGVDSNLYINGVRVSGRGGGLASGINPLTQFNVGYNTLDGGAFEGGFNGTITEARYFTFDDGAFAASDLLQAATVPEPSSSALLGLGGLALILRRRK